MALVTANGVAVLEGTITRPLRGVWTADLKVDQAVSTGFDAGTKVTIAVDGGISLVGVVMPNRTGSFVDSVHVRVCGGAGGMAKAATAQSYTQPSAFVRDVVDGLVSDAGEQLAASTDASFLSTNLAAWAVNGSMTVKQNLDTLLDIVDDTLNWRFLDDGTLWVGAESWPAIELDEAVSISFDPTHQTYVIGEDAPSIAPGTNVSGIGNVGRVEYHIQPDSIRTVVYVASDLRGFNAAVKKLVRAELARAGFHYTALYEAKVVTQNGNSVDVQPTDTSLPGLSNVPLRHGLPGVSVTVAPGCFVLVGWDGADPSKPYACLWRGGETITSVSIGSAADAVATKADIDAIKAAITAGVVVAQDGGANLKSTILAAWPTAVGSTSISIQR